MKNKKLMILGGSILQLPAIKKSISMGLTTIVVDMNPDAIGFKEQGVIKEVISTIDIPSVLKCAKEYKIDGIMTLASDMPMRTVAVVAKELNLVGISEDTSYKATNKGAMCQVLRSNKVPVPEFYRVYNFQDCYNAVNLMRRKGFFCVIKPADNSGSRGVILVADYSKKGIEKAYNYSLSYSREGDVIVEEYMDGPEVSVETISYNGICNVVQITDKLTTGAPYFVEMGHSQPSILNCKIKEQIKEIAIAANKAIGIEDGPSHTEIKITKNGPKIVELGARLGGDCITTHLVPLSTGVDMVDACIKIALGEKPDVQRKFNKASAIRYFEQEEGTLKDIQGVDDALKLPGIKHININQNKGSKIKEIRSSTDRIGFVIAQAECVEDAVELCELANDKIKILVEK